MKKEKVMFLVVGALLLVLTGLSSQGSAGVNVNIGIDVPLPMIVLLSPPSMVVIPGSYVYYAPGVDIDLLFYHGYWYRPNEGRWYRCRSYNGPWVYVARSRVPRALMDLPHDYRGISRGGRRIAYSQLRRNWGRCERNRYWDNYSDERGNGPMGHMGHGQIGNDQRRSHSVVNS
ncbi:MAG: hypothetical protein ACM3MB_00210 [Acidobacteriota bacterium]